jgi:hypothetical protein
MEGKENICKKPSNGLHLSVSENLQFVVYKMARKDRRTITGLVEYLIIQEAEKRGMNLDENNNFINKA